MTIRAGRHQTPRRGFNLIEAAIVLGVVGVVLGGIWTAASVVTNKMQLNTECKGVISTVNNIQNLISRRDAMLIGDGVSITALGVSAKVFPSDWVVAPNGRARDPLGGIHGLTNYDGGAPRFNYIISNISSAACVNLISKISLAGGSGYYSGNGLNYITRMMGASMWYATTFPVTPEQAATACAGFINDTTNYIVFTFGYTRNN